MKIRLKRTIGLGTALLALAGALPAAAKGGTWPQIGYNAGHTGFNNSEKVIDAANAATLSDTISFVTGAETIEEPVISKGIIYVRSTDGNLYAFSLASGRQVWSVPIPTQASDWGMAVGGGRLVVNCLADGGDTSGLCAFNAKSGKALWVYAPQYGASNSPPTIVGSTVYLNETAYEEPAGGPADNLVAVDLKTGAELWRQWYCNNDGCETFNGTPAVDSGTVYTGCQGSPAFEVYTVVGICAFNASSGALVWQHQLGNDGNQGTDPYGLLTASGGTVYSAYLTKCDACGYTIDITALNGTTGAPIWDTALTGALYGQAYAVGAPVLGPDGSTYEGIGNPNGVLTEAFALNADGTLRWSQSPSQTLYGRPPTLVGKSSRSGALFFTCANGPGTTCAFEASNGSFLWESSDPDEGNGFTPIVTGGAVYNTCYNDDICVYKPQ